MFLPNQFRAVIKSFSKMFSLNPTLISFKFQVGRRNCQLPDAQGHVTTHLRLRQEKHGNQNLWISLNLFAHIFGSNLEFIFLGITLDGNEFGMNVNDCEPHYELRGLELFHSLIVLLMDPPSTTKGSQFRLLQLLNLSISLFFPCPVLIPA